MGGIVEPDIVTCDKCENYFDFNDPGTNDGDGSQIICGKCWIGSDLSGLSDERTKFTERD